MRPDRRQFLTYLGIGTYGLMRSAVIGAGPGAPPRPHRKSPVAPFFTPIAPSTEDRLLLPEGIRADLVCAWGDALGSRGPFGAERFGFDCDFTAYFPIDALSGGRNANEGLLWVNHENANPVFVSRWNGRDTKTVEQIRAEKLAVGGSVIHVKREAGMWKHVPGSTHTRRFTALYPRIALSGPAAVIVGEAIGTVANCSGGRTPWFTTLSCEENFIDCNGAEGNGEYGGLRWSDVPAERVDDRHYGWVLEVDPFGELPPLKHTSLGRFAHENTAWRIGPRGHLVVYMGDDAPDQFLYKFVSAAKHDPKASRADQRKLLLEGTLYAAEFAKGKWLPLDIRRNRDLAEFGSQAEVLLRTREAARRAGATPIDRPEGCALHPADGTLYVALTNNRRHGNLYGQIIRLIEDDDRAEAESFRFEIFLAGGPQSGLACPDNLCFDRKGNLWVACDVAGADLHRGAYKSFGNNGLFFVPTSGPSAGDAFQFASGPVGCELTGPWFNESQDTLFLSVQHPGWGSILGQSPTSHWPDGGQNTPRPGVVAIGMV
jgi:uncharacterized protein